MNNNYSKNETWNSTVNLIPAQFTRNLFSKETLKEFIFKGNNENHKLPNKAARLSTTEGLT